MHRFRSSGSLIAVLFRASLILIAAGIALAAISGILLASPAQAASIHNAPLIAPPYQTAADGQAIFDQKCTGCHTVGGGKLVGPDLQDVTKRQDPQWIKNFISNPAQMIASDPAAKALFQQYNNLTMPTLGLTPQEIDALVAYLSNPAAAPAAPPAAQAPASAGDPAAGQRLFMGETKLANGGTSCIACHTVTGAGSLGGGALGPDLTHVIQRLGEPGLSASLKTIAFPTMIGPFTNHPLTPAEQVDLVAFLKQADQGQGPVPVFTPGALSFNALQVFGIGLLGAAVLFAILLAFWPKQRQRISTRLRTRKVSAAHGSTS
jgi:mono/diheme cytochrome c family protein